MNPLTRVLEPTSMGTHEPIPADRMFDAVEAIFDAQPELGGHPLASMPSRLMGHEDQPEAFCDFTHAEILAAERFLSRCGLL